MIRERERKKSELKKRKAFFLYEDFRIVFEKKKQILDYDSLKK